jgi:hypothetical protein
MRTGIQYLKTLKLLDQDFHRNENYWAFSTLDEFILFDISKTLGLRVISGGAVSSPSQKQTDTNQRWKPHSKMTI